VSGALLVADEIDTSTMGVYVYGIVEAGDARVPPGLAGLDDVPVRLVAHGDVAAAVSPVALERPPGRRAEVMAHSHVLEALAETGPVVPVQFGSILGDVDTVTHELLGPEGERWTGLLEALRDRAQYNLRVTYHEDVVLAEVVAEDADVARLRERTRGVPEDVAHADRVRLGQLVSQALERKRGQDADMVLGLVLPHVVSYDLRDRGDVDHLLDVALLVDDARRAELEDALEGLAEAMHERARFQLMGPVPPYDFVDGDWWA
jgi:gas vesicle protein GvpL/GvpF